MRLMDYTKNKISDMGRLLRRFATFFGIEQDFQKIYKNDFWRLEWSTRN